MSRGITWIVLLAAACAVLVCYRKAYAAREAPEAEAVRVCVAGVSVDLSGGTAARAAGGGEGGVLGEESRCRFPAVPLGLPGERLLAATTADGGGAIAYRMTGDPPAALATAVAALAAQGWRESAPSRLARSRSAALPLAALVARSRALYAIAIDAPSGGGSVVVAVSLGAGADGAAP
jgi:hypothetical protein